ncbi:MAG: hypothetical protein Q9157_003630 [Trypethelium eluteriae]
MAEQLAQKPAARQARKQAGEPPTTPSGADGLGGGLQQPSQLASDNADRTTQERLQGLVGGDLASLRQLASLLEEYAAAWQSPSAFGKLAQDATVEFHVFDMPQSRIWLDALVAALQKERLLVASVPPDVLDHLNASRPSKIRDRAWLVMFYSVALSTASSSTPEDEPTKARLRSNLWLAFNDVRLLLEPSAPGIQALIIMACYVNEYMTPQLCWSLISQACTMLLALGITHWHLDGATRERRAMLFWRLNDLDKALALILGRPPTLHREFAAAVPLPTLDQLLPARPHGGEPALFNAHYSHQMHLLSRIKSEVWHCLYGQDSAKIHVVRENLDSWKRQATETLEAAALAERPLLSTNGGEAVDFGLRMLQFHYLALMILLTVSCKDLRVQCIQLSRSMLNLLPRLGPKDHSVNDTYTGLLWQRLHSPLTAFGSLWGEIVVRARIRSEEGKQNLEAIEHVPVFLGKSSSQNPLAAKLQSITERFVEHATTKIHSTGKPRLHPYAESGSDSAVAQDDADQATVTTSNFTEEMPDWQPSVENNLHQQTDSDITSLNTELSADMSTYPDIGGLGYQTDDLATWPDNRFFEATFDWFPLGGTSPLGVIENEV